MQGVFIHGSRPKSKKQVKEAIAEDPCSVRLEATSIFGNEYDGWVSHAPNGTYTFVGPNPNTDRRFYGTIKVTDNGVKVS
jgi:hypothetical protein